MAIKQQRYISQLTKDTFALILAGDKGARLYELTDWRAKSSVFFGGKFRIIDFPLSNCVNSGIRRVGVLTQYKAHSLIRHIVQGWSQFRSELGECVEVLPASQRVSGHWYEGTADAVFQNLDIIRVQRPERVLILSGDHVYKMDYGSKLAHHVETGADMTISCLEVPIAEAANTFGVMTVDESGRVVGFDEKPAHPAPLPNNPELCLASMGNYVFNTGFLFEQLIKDADTPGSEHDFGKNIIPSIIDRYKVYAYPFRNPETGAKAYWRDVGTLDTFWEANMELVSVSPEFNLYDQDWPILTYQPQLPPAKFVFNQDNRRGMAVDSMVSGGCIISGAKLNRSLLFSDVTVQSHSLLEKSVVLPQVTIGRHCKIRRAIIDRGCHIPARTEIGVDSEEDKDRGFRVTASGVVLVTAAMLGQDFHYSRT